MLISNATLNALRVGVQNRYVQAWNSLADGGLWWMLLADKVSSTGLSEVYRVSDSMNRLREWVGPRQLKNIIEKSYTLTNKKYEGTYSMRVEDIEDDRWQNQLTGINDLARASKLWPNDLIYGAIIAGGSTVCYDGQYFFDTDHPLEVQGASAATQANLYAGTALTYANYVTVRTAMMNRLGNDGKPLSLRPSHLIVPPALEETAKKILESEVLGYLANTSSTASDTNTMRGTAKPLVIPELGVSSATTWYLGALEQGFKPFVYQERVAPSQIVLMTNADDEIVFNEDVVRFGVRARGAGGYGLWQTISKCTA